ncbi:MAG: hypothetical protein H6719_28375 [Sandaracinaceae bacterium]|nr:hypothetical protein [Sandaracinaceae bacterium]
MRIAIALLTLTMTACGGGADDAAGADGTSGGEDAVASNQNAPAPAPYVPAIREAPPVTDRAGSSREAPMMACGPADSYRRVAEYRCPDGTVPLGGSPSAGASARVGNVGANSTGHIIDLYRVPCPGGVVEVHVDMYGCPEMQGAF